MRFDFIYEAVKTSDDKIGDLQLEVITFELSQLPSMRQVVGSIEWLYRNGRVEDIPECVLIDTTQQF